MKILAVAPFPPQQNGGATATYNFLTRLADKGHFIEVISYLDSHRYNENLNVTGINTKHRTSFFRGINFILNSIRKGIKIGKKLKPDIIYSKNLVSPSFAGYFISKFLKKPLIVHTSGVDIQELDPQKRYWQSSRGLGLKLSINFRKRILKRATTIIANCITDLNILEQLGFGSKTIMLYNGVDKERFSSNKKNFHKKEYTICFVGRPEVEKNPHIILEIANKIPNKILLAGGTEEEYAKFGNISSNVKTVGLIKEIEKIYEESELFILPSSSEGLSNAMLEAMSMELVSLVYPSGDAKYLIEDGINGFLCESAEMLLEKITYLQNNQKSAEIIGKNARKYIVDNFDWNQSSDTFEKILLESI